MERPNILEIRTGQDLKKWYWLKAELVAFAKNTGASYVGSKFAVLDRLADKLDGGTVKIETKTFATSKFNWAKSVLTLDTIITDSYTNGPNTRKFFESRCGDKFRFSIPFMNWMKENQGKKLQDAIVEWERLETLSKDKNFKSEIPAGNEYNKYVRDFFADNPDKTIDQARRFWKLKRNLPLEKHIYEKSDLELNEK